MEKGNGRRVERGHIGTALGTVQETVPDAADRKGAFVQREPGFDDGFFRGDEAAVTPVSPATQLFQSNAFFFSA